MCVGLHINHYILYLAFEKCLFDWLITIFNEYGYLARFGRVAVWKLSYSKILRDKEMNKAELCRDAKIITNAMAKLGHNEDVRVEVFTKICKVLHCGFQYCILLLMSLHIVSKQINLCKRMVRRACYGKISRG